MFWTTCEAWGGRRTHGSGEDDDPQDVHALTGARRRAHDHVGRRRQVQREVLDVCAVVVLDTVDEEASRGGLVQQLGHGGPRAGHRDALRAVLKPRTTRHH